MAAFQSNAFQPSSFQADAAPAAAAASGGALFRYIEAQLAGTETPDSCRMAATVIATAGVQITEPADGALFAAAVWNPASVAIGEPPDCCRIGGENLTPLEVKRRRIRAADDAIISAWLMAA